MKLENGFYFYLTYTDCPKHKCQNIISFFSINDDKMVLYGFDDSMPNPIDDNSICQSLSHKLDTSIDDEVYQYLDSSFSSLKSGTLYEKEIIKSNFDIGDKYYNIYRPLFNINIVGYSNDGLIDYNPNLNDYADSKVRNNQEYYNLLNQLEILVDDLNEIFKTLAPRTDNLTAFGHSIRNIIILACTEIDAMMNNILDKNCVKRKGKYRTMNDYVKLLEPLRLREYSLSFSRHNDLPNLSPFANWDSQDRTKSLVWYDAYNKIKHDRETNFYKATLENAINSIAAYAIILIAQFGYRNDLWSEKVGKVLEVISEPQWNIKDFYIPKLDSEPISMLNEKGLNFPFIDTH